jgi:hypothetical protein
MSQSPAPLQIRVTEKDFSLFRSSRNMRGVELWLYLLLTSAVDCSDWSTS